MISCVEYIIKFLLHGNDDCVPLVGYTRDAAQFGRYKVVIVPSAFFGEKFGRETSLPQLPLPIFRGTPLLYGAPLVAKAGDTLVCYGDIVASSFFLLSRYEELFLSEENSDIHGRICGKKSLLGKMDCIQRPIVDEYGKILRDMLREVGVDAVEPEHKLARINLTHDVDTLEFYRHLRGFLGGIKRCEWSNVLRAQTSLERDAAYTFPWLVLQNQNLPMAHQICFVKAAQHGHRFDRPLYDLHGRDAQRFFAFCKENGIAIGLHASYAAGADSSRLATEKSRLEEAVGKQIVANRYHYLRTVQPGDFQQLADCGIADDYTMGYADVAGFRLGTSRPVRWINPVNKQVTSLVLHPLTAMDCTLDSERYMNLPFDAAFAYVQNLCAETQKYGGELTLLWHNTSVINDYHRELYARIIDFLKTE